MDFTRADEARKQVFDERAAVKGDLERGQAARLRLLQNWPDDLPEQPQDLTTLLQHVRTLQEAKAARDAKAKRVADLGAEARRIRVVLEDAEDALMSAQDDLSKLVPISDAEIEEHVKQVQNLDHTNRMVRDRKAWMELGSTVTDLEAKAKMLTATLEQIDERKKQMLAESVIPVPGLTFDADGVYLNGVPFEQASQAEKIRAGVAIGLSQNPALRVILIRDGSLLDADSLKALEQLAKEYKAQVWIEVVEDRGTGGILVDDGVVRDPVAVS